MQKVGGRRDVSHASRPFGDNFFKGVNVLPYEYDNFINEFMNVGNL